MLINSHIFIIFFPFGLVLFSSIIFFILQILKNKNYLLNLIISFFFTFFIILIIIFKQIYFLNDSLIFYLVFSYLCSFYLFMVLMQSTISSLQLTILRMIYLNPGIKKKEILKKYNSNNIFKERIKRLLSGGIIYKKNSSFYIKNNNILYYLKFTLLLRNIFTKKNH